VDDTGVPLEHLVSCLPGIEIYQGVGCVKYLRGLKSKGNEDVQIDGELRILQFLMHGSMLWIFLTLPIFSTYKGGCGSILW
jgi:hypothetical protein